MSAPATTSLHTIIEAQVPESDRWFDNMISFPWWSDMPRELLADMAERTASALSELRG
jgi:hypothetical protein